MNHKRFDEVLGSLTSMVKSLKLMISCYQKFPALIAQEHQAVMDHNLVRVEEIVADKGVLNQKLEGYYRDLQNYAERMYQWHRNAANEAGKSFGLNFAHSKIVIDEICAMFPEGAYKTRLFFHAKDEYIKAFTQLRCLVEEIKPHLERNKVVLARLLESHRDSYVFWSRLALEGVAPYNASGKTSTLGEGGFKQLAIKV